MKKIEDFINENRSQFEDHSPGKHHEEKFLNLLNDQKRIKSAERYAIINKWLKIAAAVLILAGFGVGIIAITDKPAIPVLQSDNQLPPDIIELEQYYSVQTSEKLNKIEKLAGSDVEADKVKSMLLNEIRELNKSSESLKVEYLKGTHDDRLVDAIKNNYRILSSLLDKVVSQLDKPSDGSSENFKQHLKSHENEIILS